MEVSGKKLAEGQRLMAGWTEQLERYGSVEFHRSRRKLVRLLLISLCFVVASLLILVTASHPRDRVISALCLALFGAVGAGFAAMWFQRSSILRVDRGGVHLPRRTPVDVGWQQIVEIGTWKYNRWSATQVLLRIESGAYRQYTDRMPAWQRMLFRSGQRTARRDCLVVQLLDAPEDVLAVWLDEQVDRLAPPPLDLVLLPAAEVSPLWGATSLRPVALDRLRLSSELQDAVLDFGRRSAPVAEEVEAGGAPGAVWGYLAGEGRELCVRVERELGARHTVGWFEDGPRSPVTTDR